MTTLLIIGFVSFFVTLYLLQDTITEKLSEGKPFMSAEFKSF